MSREGVKREFSRMRKALGMPKQVEPNTQAPYPLAERSVGPDRYLVPESIRQWVNAEATELKFPTEQIYEGTLYPYPLSRNLPDMRDFYCLLINRTVREGETYEPGDIAIFVFYQKERAGKLGYFCPKIPDAERGERGYGYRLKIGPGETAMDVAQKIKNAIKNPVK